MALPQRQNGPSRALYKWVLFSKSQIMVPRFSGNRQQFHRIRGRICWEERQPQAESRSADICWGGMLQGVEASRDGPREAVRRYFWLPPSLPVSWRKRSAVRGVVSSWVAA